MPTAQAAVSTATPTSEPVSSSRPQTTSEAVSMSAAASRIPKPLIINAVARMGMLAAISRAALSVRPCRLSPSASATITSSVASVATAYRRPTRALWKAAISRPSVTARPRTCTLWAAHDSGALDRSGGATAARIRSASDHG